MPRRNFKHGGGLAIKTPWRAQIRVEGKEIYLGAFPTWEEAKQAEDAYRERKGLPAYKPQKAHSKERVSA